MTPESLTLPGHKPGTLVSAQQVLPPERSDRVQVVFVITDWWLMPD